MTGLYEDLADWWPVISPPSEYVEEAALYVGMIQNAAREAGSPPVRRVLELGSGGGNNASHMKRHFGITLVEPADGMRRISHALNPECEHVKGDMRAVRLGRTFDAVFVHDAIMYMTTEDDLRSALATVAAHLAPGGVALVAPDVTAETFSETTEHGGGEAADGRRARYLEWTLPPEPGENTFEVHYAFLLREPDGTVSSAHDIHHEGLFPRGTWLRLFGEVGMTASLAPRTIEGKEYDAFLAVRETP
ncbi:methyltransferase domain-containing protein [Rubrobacter tropicus]|uniref:Methyltransferase domain-containing protein n=1 Tax=Rubrobacter tropicus TaxID=2653851 RepID=A0A6G8QC82_9ACTN|nr:class I SAM-dependent methyltransferase [Rubrobacter tropicus]QIN83877.1 methyltransferase domain-containing protein [Rubrobacter tropicus]